MSKGENKGEREIEEEGESEGEMGEGACGEWGDQMGERGGKRR